MRTLCVFFVGTLLISACSNPNSQQIDREAIKKEMENREIRHILPAEIVQAAYKQGEIIAAEVQEIASEAYQENDDTVDFPPFVPATVQQGIDSLAKKHNVAIHWVPADLVDTTSKIQFSELERQIREAYVYNVENDMPLNDNVQKINEDFYLYTKPIILSPEFRKNLSTSKNAANEHDFVGMWSIQLSKKNIIMSNAKN